MKQTQKTLPTQTELDRYASTINTIFTRDNLPAILAVLNSLIPRDPERLADNEYQTVIRAAKYDASLELINGVISFVATRN